MHCINYVCGATKAENALHVLGLSVLGARGAQDVFSPQNALHRPFPSNVKCYVIVQ